VSGPRFVSIAALTPERFVALSPSLARRTPAQAVATITLFPTGEQMTVTVDRAAAGVRVTGLACPPGGSPEEVPR
jgi:hypothetical protein